MWEVNEGEESESEMELSPDEVDTTTLKETQQQAPEGTRNFSQKQKDFSENQLLNQNQLTNR